MRLGFAEILLILAIALLFFGPSKLPQLGDAIGKTLRAFRKATTGPDPAETRQGDAEQPRLGPVSTAAESPTGQREPSGARR